MSFKADLAFGQQGEKMIPNLIDYDSLEIMDGYFPDYDIKWTHNGKSGTIECKLDRYTRTTHNIAIEFESNGKPSGIQKTKADNYFYFVHGTNQVYIIPTSAIKKAVSKKLYTRIHQVNDTMKNKVYLFPESVFANYFHEYQLEGMPVGSPPLTFLNDE
jgi:hypothetical protein